MGERIRVLITVKTHPLPSATYEEVVCTAGVKEDGSFVRLFPINYRSKPYFVWHKKYQWVEVDVEKHAKDPRPESYRPVGPIKTLGEPLGTDHNWAERKKFVLKRKVSTLCELQERHKEISLGIIRPSRIENFVVEETDGKWKPKRLMEMN